LDSTDDPNPLPATRATGNQHLIPFPLLLLWAIYRGRSTGPRCSSRPPKARGPSCQARATEVRKHGLVHHSARLRLHASGGRQWWRLCYISTASCDTSQGNPTNDGQVWVELYRSQMPTDPYKDTSRTPSFPLDLSTSLRLRPTAASNTVHLRTVTTGTNMSGADMDYRLPIAQTSLCLAISALRGNARSLIFDSKASWANGEWAPSCKHKWPAATLLTSN
jgi:hypothetical protein